MSNTWGKNIQLAIFGESHGPAVGITIAGLLPGMTVDWNKVDAEMSRRAPGNSPLATPRKEHDTYEVLSGIFNGRTTGSPVCAIIRNENTKPGDYSPNLLRPGHADFAAWKKYSGFADYRGGGHFSGRLTAPLVFAGALCKQALAPYGITVDARLVSIGRCFADSAADAAEMERAILDVSDQQDSLGGVIECTATGVPAGLGEPFFDSLESAISSMMFSIPAVKGIEFGDGFGLAAMRGSEANDLMISDGGKVKFLSNHAGGINGGISNGQPITLRVAIRPTPTIGLEQTTVDTETMKTVQTSFKGRHDPCIVPRAVPVIEAGLAICILDFLNKGDK